MENYNEINVDLLPDRVIVQAILQRNKDITYKYFYKKCYPLFKSVYLKYYTDCESCVEFINTIYVLIMTPGKKTGVAPLARFGYRCTLTLWLKLVSENYCKKMFKRKVNTIPAPETDSEKIYNCGHVEIDMGTLNRLDIEKVLNQISPERYRLIIKYIYIDGLSIEEAARELNMSKYNFSNKKILATAKFVTILKKEGLL